MHIGVTGTRHGMNPQQHTEVTAFLEQLVSQYPDITFHHGDCIGVDVQVARIAKNLQCTIVGHPPANEVARAFFESDLNHPQDTYLSRNRKIVNSSQIMIVVPYENKHKNRGGTWYTHDFAIKSKVPVAIFHRNKENNGMILPG